MVKVLDDFLFIEDTEESCNRALDSFISLTTLIGVPLADEKTVRATKNIQFFGITLDSAKMEASLPTDKITKQTSNVDSPIALEITTLNRFQSVIGKLQFTTCNISAGHCFLRSMYNATVGKIEGTSKDKNHRIHKRRSKIWRKFLKQHNGKTMIHKRNPVSSPEIHL